MRYILASASPRREELLRKAGLEFDIIPSGLDERTDKTAPPDIVMDLARQKALNVYDGLRDKACTVIGADTIVVYQNEILLKPRDEAEAFDMLSLLSDRTHTVYTGVCLVTGTHRRISTFCESTDVTFYPVSRTDIRAYAASGDPLDKAGGYGIQGPYAKHVRRICGDYNTVVGLPLGRLYQEIKQLTQEETI